MEWIGLISQILLLGTFLFWEGYNKKKGENLAMKEDSRDINYEVEKGKNLATKEDIDEITKIIESVKNEISFENQRKHTFIEQRTNRFINILYLVESLQMQSNQLLCYLFDKNSAEKLSVITNEINSTLLKLTHDIRLIKATIGNHNNIIQVLDKINCSARTYSTFMIYTASDALKYLTDWKIYFELANKNTQNELSAKLAISSMTGLKQTQNNYKTNIKEKEKELYTNITEYLSLLKRLYAQDFYLKFDFVDISDENPEA